MLRYLFDRRFPFLERLLIGSCDVMLWFSFLVILAFVAISGSVSGPRAAAIAVTTVAYFSVIRWTESNTKASIEKQLDKIKVQDPADQVQADITDTIEEFSPGKATLRDIFN